MLPNNCSGCQSPLTYGEQILCTQCRHELSTTAFNFCHQNECDHNFLGKTRFVKASSLFFFDQNSIIKQLLHQLKYKDQEYLGIFLSNWMAAILKKDPCLNNISIDYLVAVPLHWRRRSSRGYNQLHLFSKRLALLMGWNYCPKLLKRVRHQSSQTKKTRLKRALNTNPFALNTSLDLSHKNILIVDDLITTGSTLAHCSNAILKEYSSKIYFLSIAYRSRFV